jgi:DNA-binding transcriptional LysR family regulator
MPVCRRWRARLAARTLVPSSTGRTVGEGVIQLLEALCVVADAGSLTRAAERLHLTQPAISRQMRALERDLGVALLARTPQGVALTPAGRAVIAHARQAVAAVRACRTVALEHRQGKGGGTAQLRIAAGLMATLYVLPPVVARFRQLHAAVEVDLQPAHHRVAVERLLAHEVDAAVIASPVRSPLVRAMPVLHDPLLLVGPPSVPGAPAAPSAPSAPGVLGAPEPGAVAASAASLAELQERTVLVLPAGTGLHEQVEEGLRRHGVTCRLVEHPTAETIKTAAALGIGLTILPESAVREEVRAGTLSARPFADWAEAARVIHLVVRAGGRPAAPVSAFTALLQQHCRGGLAGSRAARK